MPEEADENIEYERIPTAETVATEIAWFSDVNSYNKLTPVDNSTGSA